MTAITIILICLAITIAYWWMKSPQKRTRNSTKSRRKSRKKSKYLATSIDYRGRACSAVRAVGRKRFLVAQVPQLPLPECNTEKCECRYIYHNDRRFSADRRDPSRTHSDLNILGARSERRVVYGRRKAGLVT